jgi:hypothetical protein
MIRRGGTYWTIVDECDVHHRGEHAIFNLVRLVELTYSLVEGLIKIFGLVAACRLVEVWLISFLN